MFPNPFADEMSYSIYLIACSKSLISSYWSRYSNMPAISFKLLETSFESHMLSISLSSFFISNTLISLIMAAKSSFLFLMNSFIKFCIS